MSAPLPRIPLFRIMLGNATLVSALYLATGLILESVRRLRPSDWVLSWLRVLDRLPATTLELLGVMEPLRRAYAYGQVGELGLRVAFGLTTVGIIFALAALVGLFMWMFRKALYRHLAEP